MPLLLFTISGATKQTFVNNPLVTTGDHPNVLILHESALDLSSYAPSQLLSLAVLQPNDDPDSEGFVHGKLVRPPRTGNRF
ncbi:hypothetical protein GYMLUDRAFT_563159 [Collybiopsis luxurians FD-317 M1]|uniref:Uncharacterized protein n=1 Tax=Collybiopsis luxurians FD-317 M1 TaxID=944289 RepID=A0A0D0BE94_9AGAR|nr:hypothetical protein GYMLUDRAFT_563159 [Collybiopsis luxurians FD-317 M1]